MVLEAIIWGSFGFIWGSFTNVLVLRKESGASLGGRSACPSCGTQLKWFELFPLLSYLALRGKCRTCHHAISLQYPLVEIAVAAGFLLVGLSPAPLVLRLLGAAIVVLFVAITAYDLRHMLIPDAWSYSFAILAFVYGVVALPTREAGELLFFAMSGPLLALPLFTLWFVSRGKWMGLGDGKLALGFGWLVGLFPGYVALMLAFVTGAIVGLGLLIPLGKVRAIARKSGITLLSERSAGFTMQSEVPFGPFLIFGVCIIWFFALYDIDVPEILLRFLSLR